MSAKAQLMIAASEHDADMLYVARLFVPDPFIIIGFNGQWHGLFSPLEVDRARKQSGLDVVHLDVPWQEKARQHGWQDAPAGTAAAFLKTHGITKIQVPGHFPLIYAEQLRGWGFEVRAAAGSLFPGRAIKSEHEILCLARAERMAKRAMHQAETFLANCSVGNDGILLHPDTGKKIRSQHVRAVIETWLIQHGASPSHTIVACGRESADPHNIGYGFVRAHQLVIIDIFPRMLDSGYWGDMTRTFVKGKASTEIKRLYRTVREGQDIGLGMVKAGANGAVIHRAISGHFETQGFPTEMRRGRQTGFFHGTGHGVGLDIHEKPRISMHDAYLKAGHVVTVEPGLYYPSLGGVRLEDLVVVREHGCENLTRYQRRLEVA
ncbi:MAG: M24 family metallopeptidase [Mariprofundaceae bacterium]